MVVSLGLMRSVPPASAGGYFGTTPQGSHVIAGGNAPGTDDKMSVTLKGSHNVTCCATLSGSKLIATLPGGVAPGYFMSRLRREESRFRRARAQT